MCFLQSYICVCRCTYILFSPSMCMYLFSLYVCCFSCQILPSRLEFYFCKLETLIYFSNLFLAFCSAASTWEISNLNTSSSYTAKCLVTQTLEINPKGWFKWRNKHCQKFEKTVPYALLCQVSGLSNLIGLILHKLNITHVLHVKNMFLVINVAVILFTIISLIHFMFI